MADAEPVRTRVNPRKSAFLTIVGKKGSGKSVLARRFWETYPFDALAVDPHGELGDERAVPLKDPLPARWPFPADHERGSASKLCYVPDPGSPTYKDDLDRAVGLAFNHRGCLLWLDEVADLTTANSTPPYMRRALHQGRHRDLTLMMCGPRPVDINPLVISQADLLFVFDLPNPKDRERIASTIGYPPKAFDERVHALGEHEYLRWDGKELLHYPPVPPHARIDREEKFAKAP